MPWEASGAWVFEKPLLPFTPFCFASFPALRARRLAAFRRPGLSLGCGPETPMQMRSAHDRSERRHAHR